MLRRILARLGRLENRLTELIDTMQTRMIAHGDPVPEIEEMDEIRVEIARIHDILYRRYGIVEPWQSPV